MGSVESTPLVVDAGPSSLEPMDCPRGRQRSAPRLRRWVLRALLTVVLVVIGAGGVTAVKVAQLRTGFPATTAFSRAAGAPPIAPVDSSAVSPWLFVAIIASEDQGFAAHSGIDTGVTRDLVVDSLHGETTRGGSTITQQLARNLWLSPNRSWPRKASEAWLALWLDGRLSKARQLELYVNVVDWGQHSFGICRASWRFFGVAPASLTREQAAALVSALPDPAHRDPGSLNASHRDLAKALVLRMLTTSAYADASVLGTVGMPVSPDSTNAVHRCDHARG